MTRIRNYQDSDASQLRELATLNYLALFGLHDRPEPSSAPVKAYVDHILALQTRAGGQIVVAEEDSRLVGFVCLLGPVSAAMDDAGQESYGLMSDLFVVEDCRRRGIGGLLVAEVEALAAERQVGKLALRVAAGNASARQFYSRRHYQEDFVVMSKSVRRKPAG